jgi:hypothetical protein
VALLLLLLRLLLLLLLLRQSAPQSGSCGPVAPGTRQQLR